MSWRDEAACAGTADTVMWFSSGTGVNYDSKQFDQARTICASCPVYGDCLAWVLNWKTWHDQFGIFAGMSPKDRANMRRRLRRASQAKAS